MLNFNKKKYVSFDNLSKVSGMIQKALSDKLKNVETNLNEKIDSRFKSLTAKEQGDSEVIDARKGEASLRAKIDVIDEDIKNVSSQLAQIKTNPKNEILKEKKENILREKLGILSQVEIMKQSELLINTAELINLKQSESNYINSINNLIAIIDKLLEGGNIDG